jgi:hypothetical protein
MINLSTGMMNDVTGVAADAFVLAYDARFNGIAVSTGYSAFGMAMDAAAADDAIIARDLLSDSRLLLVP